MSGSDEIIICEKCEDDEYRTVATKPYLPANYVDGECERITCSNCGIIIISQK